MNALYSLLVTFVAALAAPFYLVRYRRLPSGYWRERFGSLPDSFPRETDARAIWVHAVSVGETLAVAGLVGEIARRFPGRPIYLSHVTPTGRAAGERRIPGVAGRFYLPVDWKWSVRRVFERLHPAMLIIAETELWPNLLRVARERGTRVVLVNARLSERSFHGYRRFGFFFRPLLGSLDGVFAQTERDAERFRVLSVPVARISVVGNLKFDLRPPELGSLARLMRQSLESAGRGPVLVAGSTMAGEERMVLGAWDRVRTSFPSSFLVLAPRHPQRFEEVARLLAGEGRRFLRRTALDPAEREAQLAETEVLLLNTIGELGGVYELADAAFVGGSLVLNGGHNPLEPAFWAKPVLFGKHMENFRDTARLLLAEGAAFEVENPDGLAARVLELFRDAALARAAGTRAKVVLERGSGATERIANGLTRWLGKETALEVVPLEESASKIIPGV
jgi:3-deoxy-D-manno-octulosonic-acid transferase